MATNPKQPLEIHSFALSGHSHRVRLMCSFLRLPFIVREVDVPAGAHRKPTFLHLNPFGQVPVLVDGDAIIPDSNAALVYLTSKYDLAGTWYPKEALAASRVQRWLSLAAGELASGPAAARVVRLFARPANERAFVVAQRLFDWMDVELARAPFACGELPTIADVAMYTYTAHAPEGGVSLEPYAGIREWLSRVEALPGFVGMQRRDTTSAEGV